MQVFIGVDGGGSGCRAQAELGSGQRSAVVTGGAANVFSDPDRAVVQIATVLEKVLAQARALAGGDTALSPQIVLGLAGLHETRAEDALRAALPYPHLTLTGDIDIALAGAFQGESGIVMAVGTGSVLARQHAGETLRLGGHGLALGDEGSGAWIGREALRRALHARDGIGAGGMLAPAIWQEFATRGQMIRFSRAAHPAEYAAIAPLVLDLAAAHCPLACAILDDACAYLRRAILRLQEGVAGLPVAGLGGLGPVLLDRIIAQGGGSLRRVAPKGGALDGALWIARKGAGIRKDR